MPTINCVDLSVSLSIGLKSKKAHNPDKTIKRDLTLLNLCAVPIIISEVLLSLDIAVDDADDSGIMTALLDFVLAS